MGPEILHGSHPGSPDPVERGYKLCHHEALMEQRRIISVIFLFIVVAIALLLYAQYNRPADQSPPTAPTGMILSKPISVG
jgi:hypothetical protein